MPGLVPGIHDLAALKEGDVDGRDKPGHDEKVGKSGRIKNQCPLWAFFIASSCAGLALPWNFDFQVS
jgi:hypothetical protein